MDKVKLSGYTKRNKQTNKQTKKQIKKRNVSFVITYHSSLKIIGKIINQILHILCMNEDFKSVFTPAPMIFFCKARKLSRYLVWAKLYPLKRTAGSVKCKE